MNKLLPWLIWITLTGGAAWWLGWIDRFHVAFATCLLFVPVGIALRNTFRRRGRPAVAVLLAGATIAALLAAFEVVEATPMRRWMADYDRASLTEKIEANVARNDHEAIVSCIEARFAIEENSSWPTLSVAWRRELAQRMQESLIKIAQSAGDEEDQLRRLDEAVTFGQAEQIPTELAQTLRSQIAANREVRTFVSTRLENADWASAAEELRASLRRENNFEAQQILARELMDVLILWGLDQTRLQDRRDSMTEAIGVANQYGVEDDSVEALRDEIDQQLIRIANLDQQLVALEQTKNWSELATLLKLVMAQEPKAQWPRPYDQLYVDVLCRQADSTGDSSKQRELLSRAIEFAQCNDLDLGAISWLQRALDSETRRVQRDDQLRGLLSKLHRDREFAALAGLLRIESTARPKDQWPQRFDQMLVRTYQDWGDHLSELTTKRNQYLAAVTTARKFDIDAEQAARRLALVDAELARQAKLTSPTSLPPDTTASVIRVDREMYPLIVVVEVAVESNGTRVENLLSKDFVVELHGSQVDIVGVVPIEREEPLWLLLAIDTSESLTGIPWEAARKGTAALVRDVVGQDINVRLVSASQPNRVFRDWSRPSMHSASFLAEVIVEGKTAILDSILAGIESLGVKSGQRRMVVFSDGTNTVATDVTLDQIVDRARLKSIVIDVIGLRSPQLDATSLRRLAAETGGAYVEAAEPKEIADRFELTSRRIRHSGYRLAVTPYATGSKSPATGLPTVSTGLPERCSLTVKVGAENAATAATMFQTGSFSPLAAESTPDSLPSITHLTR